MPCPLWLKSGVHPGYRVILDVRGGRWLSFGLTFPFLGQAWLTDKRDLDELRSFCVTDNCRTQADHLIAAADDTWINVVRVERAGDSLIRLAQYQLT